MNPAPVKELPNSALPFPEALRELLMIRQISYRRLATRTRFSAGYLNHLACGTRPVPSDQVIKNLAKALRVKPEYFCEYRHRAVQRALERCPEIVDSLYGFLVSDNPLPGDFKSVLEAAKKMRK